MTEYDQAQVKHSLSQRDIITSTLTLLRKIRGFPESLRIGDQAYTPTQRRQFFLDAELVGSVCANLLISSPNGQVINEKETWLKMMTEVSPRYSSFPEIAVRTSFVEDAVDRVGSKLRLLRFLSSTGTDPDTQKVFQEHFLDRNKTGLLLQDLFNNRLVIFSPLSTDYLIASLLHRFVMNYLVPSCFRLKPIILSRYLEPVAMPDCNEDQSWIADANRIGVFVENNTSYDTLRATWRAVQKFSPRDLN